MRSSDTFERKEKVILKNKRAYHDFLISQTIEAGIELKGTEVKAMRQGKCSLQDAYAGFLSKKDYELWLFNMHIAEYEFGNRENHKPKRERRLLVNYREALKMKNAVMEKGMTIIPLSVYFSGHIIKVELGYAKAKKSYDKRDSEREREHEIEMKKKFKF